MMAVAGEKIVAASSKKMVVIADASKVVQKLGTTQPLPVEVTPFGHETHVKFFKSLGGEPTLRPDKNKGGPYVTDNANYIYDVRFSGGIPDAVELEKKLKSRAGKLVYSWTIAPPARSLAPGASASFNSAEVNVPPGGDELTITLGSDAG